MVMFVAMSYANDPMSSEGKHWIFSYLMRYVYA